PSGKVDALGLKRVRQGMAGPAEHDATVQPSGGTATRRQPTAEQSATATSSAEYLVGQIKSHKRSAIALAALVIAAVALAYFFYFKHNRARALQDTIVIADFDNKTGDASFDGTLK